MKVCSFLGPDGEAVSRGEQLAGGTVSASEPRGRAERSPSAAAHGGGQSETLTLNGRRRAPPRDRGQGTRQLGASESREQRACAARAGAQLDRGLASDVRRGGRRGLAERPACGAGRHAAASWGARLALRAGVGAILFLAGFAAAANFAKPGDVVTIPWDIVNADSQGNPGGDTINSIKVTILASSGVVTNVVDSAVQSIAPGETKTFSPKFTVGNVQDGTYSVTLRIVSSEPMDPPANDPASDTSVNFNRSRPQFLVENYI